jgi:hypothetical protein
MVQLHTAMRTIHADRDWWHKILVGGALWITLAGWPLVEGHQLESIDNSQRGYPTPLPRWHAFSDKLVIGIFALVIDFFFFLFPILLGGVLLLCGTLTTGLAIGPHMVRPVTLIVMLPLMLYLFSIWLLGVSPVSKQRYVEDGDLASVLSFAIIREQLQSPARVPYLRARLLSIPAYGVALLVLVLTFPIAGLSTVAAVLTLWLGTSLLFYARLLAIQLYIAATRDVTARQFEIRTRRAET